ncbi:hypothetical protein N0V90_004818 [Kalmusia sp. IMI 367209]|nr:hypothetical protein N0V90_004818 [Kalmusia sp. IMI 367209]
MDCCFYQTAIQGAEFSNGWIQEIKKLMTQSKSLRYSVLANAASNLHFIESSGKFQELALTYYSKALRGLSDLLTRADQLENHNSILMSMMLLYLHGCMGRGTYFDIPRHLNAATQVLALRLFKQTPTIGSPFDRLAVESVLYQIFLVTTGLWSDEEVNHRLDYDFDLDFWLRAERLLDQSRVFPGQSDSLNSPVLGVPAPLFRLALTLKQMYQGAVSYDQANVGALRNEIEVWEGFVLCDKETDLLSDTEERNHKHAYYRSASYLFILIISLLFEQLPRQTSSSDEVTELSPKTRAQPPSMVDPDSWQIRKAVQILKSYQTDHEWASCFIGNWPVYTIGFFMRRPEHVQLTRSELQRRWTLTKFNQVARFCNDLEKTWAKRELIFPTEIEPLGRCWANFPPPPGTPGFDDVPHRKQGA